MTGTRHPVIMQLLLASTYQPFFGAFLGFNVTAFLQMRRNDTYNVARANGVPLHQPAHLVKVSTKEPT